MVRTGLLDGLDGSDTTTNYLQVKGSGVLLNCALSGATTVAGTVAGGTFSAGTFATSNYDTGSNAGVTLSMPARSIISGGMFVAFASGTATAVSVGAATAPVHGVCNANVASGASATILTQGVRYMFANGDVAAGELVAMGAGAALNGVVACGSTTYLSVYTVGKALNGAASGTAVLVPVLLNL